MDVIDYQNSMYGYAFISNFKYLWFNQQIKFIDASFCPFDV